MSQTVILGKKPLTIEDVVIVSQGHATLALSDDKEFRNKIQQSQNFLNSLLENKKEIYGVTTGYGDSCTTVVNLELISQLPTHLVRYHGCGLGDYFSESDARAIQVSRIASLVQGLSGMSLELLQFLVDQVNMGITPRIPKEGSVGASGDLTPLSYLAATAIGEGEVFYKGEIYKTKDLYEKLQIKPVGLKPKEGLAIMNGTAVMTALACLAFKRAEYLCQIASKITAANAVSLLGNPCHFDKLLFDAKPHKGQGQIAEWIRSEFSDEFIQTKANRLQDRYSIRCAPHVIGVLQDSLYFFRTLIETEMNSANDNPLIDGEMERVIHGGNFYGGHIAFAMDSMKVLIANVSDLLDRQLALLVDTKYNNGLPSNLSGAIKDKSINHGLKAVQIGTSAWTAEALKMSLPASVFSRSTECHNQDKVSMGTIAARDCIRSLELTEQVTAACALASAQALELRQKSGELTEHSIGQSLIKFKKSIFREVSFVEEDRQLDKDLRYLVHQIQNRTIELYT